MIYFISGLNEQRFTNKISAALNAKVLKRKISKFTDGELKVEIENKNLKGKKVFIVLSMFDSINDKVMELSLLANAIKNLGCKNITAIIPYFGYSRQDKAKRGEAFALKCIAEFIKTSGIKKIITLDLHNPKSIKLFDLPVINLSVMEVFKDVIKDKKNSIIVAPDVGSKHRAQEFAEFLHCEWIFAKKERDKFGKIKIKGISKIEKVKNRDCYLIDDILDTGSTICSVAEKLKKFKPNSIKALVCHGLFQKKALQKIEKSSIEKIYITNSINHNILRHPKVCSLDVSLLITNYLKRNDK